MIAQATNVTAVIAGGTHRRHVSVAAAAVCRF
jgi:hypothetical protein